MQSLCTSQRLEGRLCICKHLVPSLHADNVMNYSPRISKCPVTAQAVVETLKHSLLADECISIDHVPAYAQNCASSSDLSVPDGDSLQHLGRIDDANLRGNQVLRIQRSCGNP